MDFIVQKKKARFKILQITDMQWIDAAQQRTPDRLAQDEQWAWPTHRVEALCGNQIRSLVAQTKPDLIITTGDNVYGSFDDNGSMLERFCTLMDSFEIPWAPVFGNHDNESAMGVDWQCRRLEESKYCLFKQGAVTGNGNYGIGIAEGERLIRLLHMVDTNGRLCPKGIYPDQLEQIRERAARHPEAKGMMAFHIPVQGFAEAERAKGYEDYYTIGVDYPAAQGDFGFKYEPLKPIELDLIPLLKECRIDGVFAGHCHRIATHISYEGIRWVFGLKTGQYDYHLPGSTGGTLITLEGEDFTVQYVPSMTPCAPYPASMPMFKNFFAEEPNV